MDGQQSKEVRRLTAAQAMATMDEEMVRDTGILEPRRQRDECYMLLLRALDQPDGAKPFTTVELEKLTLRSGILLLMLPNGWARVNELAQGEYGLRGEYVRCQRWKMRPEFYAINPWKISERALGHQIDIIFDNWDPKNLMDSQQTDEFYLQMAGLQHEMVHKTVAERVGILGSQLDEIKKARIEEVVEVIQKFLRAGVPDPFQVQEIQNAITELRGDPFAMDAMKLLVEDMSTKATNEFAIHQLTAILGELNVAAEVGTEVVEAANGDRSDHAETDKSSNDKAEGDSETRDSSSPTHSLRFL